MQRDLAKSNVHLRWLNEQKNQLLGMAAHDLRNPLAAILAYCQFILDDGETLTEDQSMMLDRIRESSEFMLVLIEDVLDLSAIESGTVNLKLEEFDVDQAVTDVVTVCGPITSRKSIALSAQRGTSVPRLRADRGKLAQVLQNLVSNSVKFSMPGTRVRHRDRLRGRDERHHRSP